MAMLCNANSTRRRKAKCWAQERSSILPVVKTSNAYFTPDFTILTTGPIFPAQSLDSTGPTNAPREFRETNYFAAIGSCITQILDATVAQKLSSVAFPLIGCGLFGLDEKMLFLQFLDAIEELDDRLAEGESLHVWLVIRDRAQFEFSGRNVP